MEKISFTIDKKEVLRYAGHKSGILPGNIDTVADRVIALCQTALNPRYIIGRYKIQPVENGILLPENGLILQGMDISKHLSDCDECVILCATRGNGADSFIRTMSAIDTVHGIFADAAATRAVESLADNIEEDLRNITQARGRFLTWRYSPGYGDFPFTQQPDILNLLQADKLAGVTCNQSCIMTPAKSITAVMGIKNHKPVNKQEKCYLCPNRENCNFSCVG